MSKIEWYSDDDFTVELEDQNGVLFFHLPKAKWSKRTIKKQQEILKEIESSMKQLGYTQLFMGPTPCPRSLDIFISKYMKYTKVFQINDVWIYRKEL